MAPALDMARRVSPKGWAMVGGAFAAAVLFIVVVMHFASSPSYTTLQSSIDPSQAAKMESTLASAGIGYQLQDGGTAIAVVSSKLAQARVSLSSAGLLGDQQQGFSLLDKQSLGQSNFQQSVTYERALEGQLASTIEQINGVSSAEVNLVIPNSQDELFSDQTQSASASVLLSGSSNLQASDIRGIAQTVASSVQGLSINKVTITGPDGALLWPSSASSGSGGLPAQEAAEQKYDATMSDEVDAMLAQTLGPGKAQVVVNATLDDNRAVQESLVYGKNGVPLSAQTSNETLKGAAASAGGTSGTSSSIPSYSSGTGSGSGNSNYKNSTNNTDYGVDKTITHQVIAPGAITRQSVSVLVSSTVPAAELATIKQSVSNAVGLDPTRGDQISVSALKFASTPAATAAKPATVSPLKKYGKYGALGLVSLLFLGFMLRLLRKRERQSFSQPKWLTELEAPRPLPALPTSAAEVARLQPKVGVARQQVEELVQRDPDRIAQHLRAWMAEE